MRISHGRLSGPCRAWFSSMWTAGRAMNVPRREMATPSPGHCCCLMACGRYPPTTRASPCSGGAFAVAPMGLTGMLRPQGDLILARCAQRMALPLELLLEQIQAVEAERDALKKEDVANPSSSAMLLQQLKGIGPESASVLAHEGLCRHFDNRRQLAAYAGLAASPWRSGKINREQGNSKSGNPRLDRVPTHGVSSPT